MTHSERASRSDCCLVVACGSVLNDDGYSARVWMSLRALQQIRPFGSRPPMLVSFESLRNLTSYRLIQRARHRAAEERVELALVPLLPKKLPMSFSLNQWWCAAWIGLFARCRGIAPVQAHSADAAAAAERALRYDPSRALIFDAHGADIEERLEDGRLTRDSWEHRLREGAQRRVLRRANDVFCVTDTLAEHLRVAKWRIVPCIHWLEDSRESLESARMAARSRLNVGDRPVVTYLGSASIWQQPRLVVESFAQLLRERPDAVLLVITPHPEAFREIVKQSGLEDSALRILSLSRDAVAATVVAADVGLLLRADTIVNRVASPTKFAEYLSAGVAVVISEVHADFAALTRTHDLGEVVSAAVTAGHVARAVLRLINAPVDDQAARRQRCREVARRHLSFDAVLDAYREAYRTSAR